MEQPSQLSVSSFPNYSRMRGERPPVIYTLGDPIPTIAQLLLRRVEIHVKEAGLEPEQITQNALQLFQLQEPESITDIYKGATIEATIIRAIHELMPMGSIFKVEYFKLMVYAKAKEYIAQLMQSNEPASEAFTLPRINQIFDPYVFKAEKQLYLNCAALPQDIMRHPPPGHSGAHPSRSSGVAAKYVIWSKARTYLARRQR